MQAQGFAKVLRLLQHGQMRRHYKYMRDFYTTQVFRTVFVFPCQLININKQQTVPISTGQLRNVDDK